MVQVANSQQSHVIMFNVYAPSGANNVEARAHMDDMIRGELAAHAHIPCVLMGDFNQELSQSNLHAQLQCQQGWRLPPLVDEARQPIAGTLQHDSLTWLDGVMMSPKVPIESPYQIALACLPRRHAPVWVPFSVTDATHPKIPRPPKLQDMHVSADSHNWEELEKDLQSESQTELPYQERVEKMWIRWTQAIRSYLAPRVTLNRGKDMCDLGRCILYHRQTRTDKKQDKSPLGICRHAIHKLHGHSPLTPRRWAWYLDRQTIICKTLQLTPLDFLAAQNNPHQARQEWASMLSKAEQQSRQMQVKAWRSTLEWKEHPTPKLYQWL